VPSPFAREIVAVVSPHYTTASRAVGMLAMSLAVFGIGGVALTGIRLTRRMGYVAVSLWVPGVVGRADLEGLRNAAPQIGGLGGPADRRAGGCLRLAGGHGDRCRGAARGLVARGSARLSGMRPAARCRLGAAG